jgi:phage nucleotide-binding protein
MAVAVNKANEELREKLQVAPPSAVLEYLNLLVYGDPGSGKTTLLGTAADEKATSPVLVLDVEGGVVTIRKRDDVDVIQIRSTKDLEKTYDTLVKSVYEKGGMYYKVVGIDSLSELATLDMGDIMKEAYNRNPDKVDVDVPSPREWGKSREHMRKIVRAFRDLPCHVIFTSHVYTQIEEGQPNKYMPAFSGKLRSELPGFMDIVGYLSVEVTNDVSTRRLQFAQTRRVIAKDRTDALGDLIENPTLPHLWKIINGGK